MREVNNQKYSILLWTIILLGSQHSLALNPTSDASASTGLSSFPNERILEDVSTTCTTSYCTQSNSIQGKTDLVFKISFWPQSKIALQILVGETEAEFEVKLETQVLVPMQTTFALSPRDSSQDVSVTSLIGCNWETSLSFGSSASSSRQLIVTIENQAASQSTLSYLTITVPSTNGTSIGGAIGGAIGGVVVVVIIVLYIRRRRMRKLMRRRRAEASYQAQNIQQFPPQQQPGQPGPFQAQLQGSIMYQPINPNSPNYQMQMQMQMQQSGNIQYVPIMADPNHQQQPNIQYVPIVVDPNYQLQQSIQYVPVANYPQPDYQGQGIQLAPPVQMIMPVNPEEGPLSEMNFNHRFPEAPFQNFSSSFPQKTCSVCLEDLKTDQSCRQLYCEHIFHGDCAKDWLLNQMVKQNHGYCPNCNKNMTFVLERAKP